MRRKAQLGSRCIAGSCFPALDCQCVTSSQGGPTSTVIRGEAVESPGLKPLLVQQPPQLQVALEVAVCCQIWWFPKTGGPQYNIYIYRYIYGPIIPES